MHSDHCIENKQSVHRIWMPTPFVLIQLHIDSKDCEKLWTPSTKSKWQCIKYIQRYRTAKKLMESYQINLSILLFTIHIHNIYEMWIKMFFKINSRSTGIWQISRKDEYLRQRRNQTGLWNHKCIKQTWIKSV